MLYFILVRMCKEVDININNKRLRFLRKIKNFINVDYNVE